MTMAKVVITFKSTCTLEVPDSAESLRKLGDATILDICEEYHDLSCHIAEETYADDIQIED